MLHMPESLECQRARDDSTTSIEKTAPEIAPIPAPRKSPLSVANPIRPPVMAPTTEPTEEEKGKGKKQTFVKKHNKEPIFSQISQPNLKKEETQDQESEKEQTCSEDAGDESADELLGKLRGQGTGTFSSCTSVRAGADNIGGSRR